MLEARDVRKSFNGFAAIGGVSLTVPERGITALIGPNGAGKSTLFNLLTGHLRADAGTVSLQGRDITAAAPHAICRLEPHVSNSPTRDASDCRSCPP